MKIDFRCVLIAAAFGSAFAAAHAQAPAAKPAASASAPKPAAALEGEKEKGGRLAAQAWLQMLDRKDWGTAWDSASPLFRLNAPLAAWMDGIPKVREVLGALKEREAVDASHTKFISGYPEADYVNVTFESKFANKNVQEIVTTMLDLEGRWRVTGYTYREIQ